MRCPVCHHMDQKVIDSRDSMGGYAVRRRRECLSCHFRFSTIEEPEILELMVHKKNGKREYYSREKMVRGVLKSLEKRTYTPDDFRRLVGNIESNIQSLRKNEVDSVEIGNIVMKHLKDFDDVAYIRYASVYKSFKDVKTLHKEIAKLLEVGAESPKAKKKRIK